MFILYPQDYFNKKIPDESFIDETQETSKIFSIGTMFSRSYQENEKVLYRGWMLSSDEYDEITSFCGKNTLSLLTSKQDYYHAHYMNNWYDEVKDITPETYFFNDVEQVKNNINDLPFEEYFIKDSVKSLTTKRGSIAHNVDEVLDILNEINSKKGIEGVIAIRKVHNFVKNSEIRYFASKGKIFSPNGIVSPLAEDVAKRFSYLNFISVDIIKDTEGKEWLVEIGDGQVSDIKMWNPADFSKMLLNV